MIGNDIKIVQDYDLEGGMWVKCKGSYTMDHDQAKSSIRVCPRCGDADSVTFKKGDKLTLYLKKNKLIRIDVGPLAYILGYD